MAGQGCECCSVAAELVAVSGAGLGGARESSGLEVDHGPGAAHAIGEVDPAVEDLAARPVDEGDLAVDDVRGADRGEGRQGADALREIGSLGRVLRVEAALGREGGRRAREGVAFREIGECEEGVDEGAEGGVLVGRRPCHPEGLWLDGSRGIRRGCGFLVARLDRSSSE